MVLIYLMALMAVSPKLFRLETKEAPSDESKWMARKPLAVLDQMEQPAAGGELPEKLVVDVFAFRL